MILMFAIMATTKMSATIISEPVIVSSSPEPPSTAASAVASSSAAAASAISPQTSVEIESAQCDCCGLTEECTPAYIETIRERYMGKWICGLCAEAVKDEVVRSETRLISTDEALMRHMNVCKKFRSPISGDPTVHLIAAMRQILRRSLDCPRVGGVRSTPSSPTRAGQGINRPLLARSGSCFSTLSGS